VEDKDVIEGHGDVSAGKFRSPEHEAEANWIRMRRVRSILGCDAYCGGNVLVLYFHVALAELVMCLLFCWKERLLCQYL
jgi:hypothetical protein